ncbi:Mid-1-related chloride channel (MCLC) family protein [Acanthocheilonema viteae]
MLLVVIYWDLLFGCNGENIDLNLHVDRENWLDPNDPFASPLLCTKNTLDELAVCQENLKKCLKVEDHAENHYVYDSTLKHIIRNFLHRMNVEIDTTKRVDRTVQIYLNAESLAVLKKYLNSKDETVTVREQVREVLEEMIVPQHYEDISFVKRASDMIIAFLPLLNAVLLVPALLILYRNRFSIRSFILFIFFISFVISVFNTFYKKYQANIAARMARTEKSLTEKCKTDNFLSTAINVVSRLFVFKGENECEQHYKDLYVDPIYEIAPLDVICEVLSNFIFTSLSVFGRHFNVFCNEFFRDCPLHLIIMKIITFFFLFIVFLFWLGGYRIRTFMTAVEPAGTTTHTISQMLQLSDYRSSEEQQQIEALKSRTVLSTLPVGLQPIRNTVSSNTRRRSLSVSRLSTTDHW